MCAAAWQPAETSLRKSIQILLVVDRRRREVGADEEAAFEGGGFPAGKKVYVSCDAAYTFIGACVVVCMCGRFAAHGLAGSASELSY